MKMISPEQLTLGYPAHTLGRSLAVHADSFDWLCRLPAGSLSAIVTDPPYGVKEYEEDQIEKRDKGVGGVWRIPQTFDGVTRAPVPRFTALNSKERQQIELFFIEWGTLATKALKPGGHVFLASNSFLSQLIFAALIKGGLEFRGELIRLVGTLRGGDRPKGAEEEFSGVCTFPRGAYEPWGILRNPLPPGMKVSDCLREHGTGGLRRTPDDKPFSDVIVSERTPRRERAVADHPSIKPQSLLRQLVRASLPLGTGIVADPFMGSGSTVAAAEAIGVSCIGVEKRDTYYQMALTAIPRLRDLKPAVSQPIPQTMTLDLEPDKPERDEKHLAFR